MLTALTLVIALSMMITLIRGIQGPTRYDRFMAMNSFGTQLVILIVIFGVITDNVMIFDIALVYALINSIATIAFLNYVRGEGKTSRKPHQKVAKKV